MTQHTFPDFKGNDHPQQVAPQPPRNWQPAEQYPRKKPRRWLTILISCAIAAPVGYAIGAAGSSETKAPTSITTLPGTQVSTPGKVTPGAKKVSPPKQYMKQDGVYLVPENVEPGTYRNGSTDTTLCAWERLKGTSGDPDELITAGFGPNQVVTIKKTDKAFKVTGCGPWVFVPAK